MKLKPMLYILLLAGTSLQLLGGRPSLAQSTDATSNYTFRFNTGVSSVFLSEMTFVSEQPLDLGTCTTNEKINGPLSCAVNCQSQSVCLLDLSGPSGSSVNDVLEIASETPVSGSTASPNPAASGNPSAFGSLIQNTEGRDLRVNQRIEAYNQIGG